MASLLKTLSAALVVAGAVGGTYLLIETKNPALLGSHNLKLRPTIDEFVGEGTVALNTLMESAKAARRPAEPHKIVQARLPFVVIEPRDFAAPMAKPPTAPAPETIAIAPAPAPEIVTPRPPQPDLQFAQGTGGPLMDLEPVEARLRARVSAELFQYFDLYLYVSKAADKKGHWSQRMFVLAKQAEQPTLALLYDWAVSTGLEETIPSPSGAMMATDTPQGVFKLDRGRFYQDYTSRQWQAPMPNAMFFDWRTDGRTSGLAIHGTDEEGAKQLGERASHGCIRLAPENARILFDLIQSKYRGRVPVFQINPKTDTMSTTGALVRDENGDVQMSWGYKVLVFIEDYGGPSVDTVAALY